MNKRNTITSKMNTLLRRHARHLTVPRENPECGSVLATVALSLVVLLGFAALALDGGSAYNERRTTQNGADNTALAAAWAHCMGIGDPIVHAQGVAAANGFDSTQVFIEHEGGVLESQYRARITSISETTFARVIGTDEVTVVSEATAACERTPGGGAFAMFAKGPDCELVKGGNATVTGDVYSAGDMTWNGGGSQTVSNVHTDANLTVDGNMNITGTASASGTASSNPYDPSILENEPQKNLGYPVDFEIDDFSPGSPVALAAGVDRHYSYTGNIQASAINANGPGIHFVQGNVVTTGQPLNVDPITIVATGTITLNGAEFTAFHEGLAMMAGATTPNPSCSPPAIDLAGNSDIAGLLFAPNGHLRVVGGTVNGGMIAWSIFTGGSLDLDVDATLFPGGLPQVFLLR